VSEAPEEAPGAEVGAAEAPLPRWKRVLFGSGLVLGSLLAALVLLEIVVRIFFAAPRVQGKQLITMKMRQHHERDNQGADCYPSNPRHYFLRTVPDDWPGAMLLETEHYTAIDMKRLSRTPYCVDFSNNAEGYRGPLQAPARAPNTFRVLAVGDSFTYGEGVKDADTMPAQLQRVLQERHPELAVEVVNLGEPGVNTEKEIITLRARMGLDPDVVLLDYVLNDAFRVAAIDVKKHAADDLVMFRPGRIEKPKGLKRWLRKYSRLYALIAARLDQRRIHHGTKAWYSEAFDRSKNAEGMAKTERMIATFVGEARSHGAVVLTVVYPILYQLGDDYPFAPAQRELEAMLDRVGVPWLDLGKTAFARRSAADLVVHAVDHHPNEIGQRLAAEAVAAELERLGFVHARPAREQPAPATPPPADGGTP